MEQDIKITVENGVKELVILNGAAEPVYHEKAIEVTGASIGAVKEYLCRKGISEDEIVNSKVEFSFDGLYLNLYYDVRRRNPDIIKGAFRLHPDLIKFKINSDKKYNTIELSDFIKMNRHYFENRDYAMKLVSDLRNFEGKVNKEIELKADNRANTRALIHQVVESNIPETFVVHLPIFIGQEALRIEVEVNINASFECMLVSPELKQMIDEKSKQIIEAELEAIKLLYADLKIFEF